jgi:hypothetical protein
MDDPLSPPPFFDTGEDALGAASAQPSKGVCDVRISDRGGGGRSMRLLPDARIRPLSI